MNLANSRLLVKNKATGTPLNCMYSYVDFRLSKTCVDVGLLYIYVGLSALLVSTNRAMREPIHSGTSDKDWLHVFLCILVNGINNNQISTLGAREEENVKWMYNF